MSITPAPRHGRPLLGLGRVWGTLGSVRDGVLHINGLGGIAEIGDQLRVSANDTEQYGEVVALDGADVVGLLAGSARGLRVGQRIDLAQDHLPAPSDHWFGHVIDAYGRLSDGRAARRGSTPRVLDAPAPPGADRRATGTRLQTGYSVFDTILPITHGQRLGIFSGSGVGKSSLLAGLSERVGADATVIGLIGERGREVGELARRILGGPAAERTVIIAATSDQSALARRRAAYLTLAVAEHFRDEGRQVLCLLDSLTRFAEAHREIALAAGELPALRGFPPSTLPAVAGLCERAGPGVAESVMGDITALFTVLVAGGDMDEPIADLVRGILDGHVILDREIAERGRFPSIDVRRSVSRSAPGAWSEAEQAIAVDARRLIAAYEDVRPMIQSGLYIAGADPVVDRAVKTWPALDEFVGSLTVPGVADEGFRRLAAILSSASEQ